MADKKTKDKDNSRPGRDRGGVNAVPMAELTRPD